MVTSVAAGERLVGRARVTDGDTLRVGGVPVRLKGLAAPEAAHGGDDGEPGGIAAKAFMVEHPSGLQEARLKNAVRAARPVKTAAPFGTIAMSSSSWPKSLCHGRGSPRSYVGSIGLDPGRRRSRHDHREQR